MGPVDRPMGLAYGHLDGGPDSHRLRHRQSRSAGGYAGTEQDAGLFLRYLPQSSNGVLYLRDGAFGRPPKRVAGPRQTHLGRRWYVDRIERHGHFWRVDIDAAADSAQFTAIDEAGVEFDRVVRRRRHHE